MSSSAFECPGLPVSFWAKTSPCPMSGCWLWYGARSSTGYGNFNHAGRTHRAHRFAYVSLVGEVGPGLHIDHLCRTPLCVNPAHMEPVTPRVNTMRGTGLAATNAAKQFCLAGHPYDEAKGFV